MLTAFVLFKDEDTRLGIAKQIVQSLAHEGENNDDVGAAACLGRLACIDPSDRVRSFAASSLVNLGSNPRLQLAVQVSF